MLEFQLKSNKLKDAILKMVKLEDLVFTEYRKKESFVGRKEEIYTLECQRKCDTRNGSPKTYNLTAALVVRADTERNTPASEKTTQVESCAKPLTPEQLEARSKGGKATHQIDSEDFNKIIAWVKKQTTKSANTLARSLMAWCSREGIVRKDGKELTLSYLARQIGDIRKEMNKR